MNVNSEQLTLSTGTGGRFQLSGVALSNRSETGSNAHDQSRVGFGNILAELSLAWF